MFKVFSHQGNANQNYSEISSYIRIAKIKPQVVAHAGKNMAQGKYASIACGSANCTSTIEINLAVFQKFVNSSTSRLSYLRLGIYPKDVTL